MVTRKKKGTKTKLSLYERPICPKDGYFMVKVENWKCSECEKAKEARNAKSKRRSKRTSTR